MIFLPPSEIPRLGDHRRRFEILVELGEADHEIGNDIERNMIGGDGPVQARRFGAEIDSKMVVGAALGADLQPLTTPCKLTATEDEQTGVVVVR